MSATMNVTEVYTGKFIYSEGSASVNGSIVALNFNSPLSKVINIFTIVMLFITMISLGCTMEISKIKAHFFRPKATAIALLAQFGIMPLTAFCLARILQMDPVKALTVLICGCCPGGSLSNIFALAIKGDMNLSIVMTTCSSFAALVLMPLLLYILCQGVTGLEKAVPYASIIAALTLTLVPCTIGIVINHYKPSYSPVVKKVGLSILIISSLIVFILSGIDLKDVLWIAFQADILGVAALMPLIGFMLGYVMSVTCGLNAQCSRTISMETGCQNIQLCFAILKVAFPPQDIGYMFLFPLIYIIFQCSEALLLAMCFRCYQTFKAPAKDMSIQQYQSADVKQEEVKHP
ncbi:sodium/bile acid cotransporter-like [Xiphias gladius]|uniref:sodium/bile acid cotransporter-like n=1 Tax=Xiphias gladius TaxID=8245 RepID=UPI001A997B4F|nr:sodium/bile acid cotransporter-like [Xiphias gladius]XP_039993277.1 sodium/bile acid cotransporter-like [Xiphias gladius]XP_039993278.1 sodium/bile acid cotransporter-like [Xiphias gladius]XP_039993279.1 sodium/bile acid cotransporter-like [Xiphias gladius]XP_039993280.1 sodium/bile acid cotransporter-like [Xiphias gladius]